MTEIPPDRRAKLQETVPGQSYVIALDGVLAGLHICPVPGAGPWLVRTTSITPDAFVELVRALHEHLTGCFLS